MITANKLRKLANLAHLKALEPILQQCEEAANTGSFSRSVKQAKPLSEEEIQALEKLGFTVTVSARVPTLVTLDWF